MCNAKVIDWFKNRTIISLHVQITGYPLHLQYNDTTKLFKTVESTGLHLCELERVEFAMACAVCIQIILMIYSLNGFI